VLRQWSSVREELFTYSHGYKPTQAGAWRSVVQKLGVAEVCDVVQLYVLSQLLVAQSADVERGFSLMKDCLGVNSLSMKTITLDCRLRIKTGLYLLTNGGKDVSKEKLEWMGACPEPGSSDPSCVQIYQNMLLPNKPQTLVARLHDVLSMENSSMWLDTLASEFDLLEDEVICGDEEDSVDEEGDVADVDTMVLLLTEGLPDDAE
jgi:hypothetical protein